MIRRFLIGPDHEARAAEGVVPAVSLDALTQGLAEAAVLLYRNGGHLQVSQERRPGLLENEYLTTAVVVEWRDRTDAKPRPEVPAPVVEEVVPAPALMEIEDEPLLEPREQRPEEEEVDESSIPASMRG